MTIQGKGISSFILLLPFLFQSLVAAQPARKLSPIVVDGAERAVFYEKKDGVPRKYFLDANGKRVDLAAHQRRKAQEKREKYGAFGKKLFDTLAALPVNAEVDVQITFVRRALPGALKNRKLTREEAEVQTEASFHDGIKALERRLGPLAPEHTHYRGRNTLRLRLTKSTLHDLKASPQLQSIDLPIDPRREKVLRQAPLEESFLGSGWNSGGLHFAADCGEEFGCGSAIRIGVLERNPIWNSDSADHLDGAWFVKRPGTPLFPRHPHGLWTSSILRNSGPGLTGSAFNGGGAYNADLFLSYPVAPESTMQDAYAWLLYDQYTNIINHSWRFPRYLGGTHEAEANEFERQMDMAAAGYPYVLNVQAAGNSGDTADGGENDACVDSSAVYDPPGWTAEQCQRVAWWNHNGLIVGAVDDDSTRSAFSAFGNGPEFNEAPHVVARGSGIQLPWMAPFDSSNACPTDTAVANASGPLCGTSLAAPTVAALAAHLAGVGSLAYYPEVVKGIVMASATSRPIRRSMWNRDSYEYNAYKDRETGTGIPHQPTADSILRNERYGSNFSAGVHGFKRFMVPSNETTYDEWDTITVSHPQGGVIHFYMTWMGNPSNVTPGTRYEPDDLDLYVSTVDGNMAFYSASFQNTTEYVSYPMHPDTTTTFIVRRRLYNRLLDENTAIWGSLVWTYTPPPVVEIHSPLDSSFANQNDVPVEWSIGGVPASFWTSEFMYLEGPNLVTRCYEYFYFCDSITVFLDMTPPVVDITSPASGANTTNSSIMVRWTVDGVLDSVLYHLSSGANQIIRSSSDLAGNVGADTIIVNGKFLTASADGPDTVFTYSNFSLNAGSSAASEGGGLVFKWTQIAGNPVAITGDSSKIAMVLSRRSGLLTFELKIEEIGSSIPADFDTISIAVREPSTLAEMMGILAKGSQAQDSQFTIKIGTPNPIDGVSTWAEDTTLLAGTMSADTGIFGQILWYTPLDSGSFQPQDAEWDSLPIPLVEGDNWITLVHGRGSRIAVDRILIGYQPGVEFGEFNLSPDAFLAGQATDFNLQVPVTGDSIESVYLMRVDNSVTIIGEMKDDGNLPDTAVNDGVFSLKFSLTPTISTTYSYRIKVSFTNRPDAYSPIRVYRSQNVLSHADFLIVSEINAGAANMYDSLLGVTSQEQAMDAVADWLVTLPEVALAGIGPDGKALCWQFFNGIHAFINAAPEGTKGIVNKAKAKGLSPHLSQFGVYDDGLTVYNNQLRRQNPVAYNVDSLKADASVAQTSTNLSIEDWKNWGGYKTVVVSTHGNTFGYKSPNQIKMNANFDDSLNAAGDNINGFTFFTNPYQVLSTNLLLDSSFMANNRSDFNSPGSYPRMVIDVAFPTGSQTVWITPKFIEKYDKGLEGSLIYISACRSTYNSGIWDAIRGNGDAKTAMIGYSDYVASNFAGKMGEIIYRNLTRGVNLKNSVDSAVAHCASGSQVCGGVTGAGRAYDTRTPPAFLDYMGNKDYSLIPTQMWSWGYNGQGRLGKGDTTRSVVPVKVKDLGILKVEAGTSHTLVLAADSSIWSWGDNAMGQTGLGTGYYFAVNPAKITNIGKARDISAGFSGTDHGNSYAILADSTLVGWGKNALGTLGVGGSSMKYAPTSVNTSTKFLAVAAGVGHTLGIASDSSLWVWGINYEGQLGIGSVDTLVRTTPFQNTALSKVIAIAVTERASFAITPNGNLYGWGSNDAFVLGNTTVAIDSMPRLIMTGVKAISGGYFPSIIKNDGSAWYWGGYSFLYAGYNSGTPKRLTGIGNTVSICTGYSHLLAVDSKGTVKGMGENYYGMIGDGTTSDRSSIVPVGKFLGATQASCGEASSFVSQ